MRYALPQPYEEMPHTADVGVRVEGSTPEEALARLCLALSALLSGGGEVPVEREVDLEVAAGADPSQTAVAVLRELLFRFATERVIAGAVEVVRLDGRGTALRVGLGRFDPARHEGADVKAVTYHLARFGRAGDRWRAQVVLDI
ncbi:MAG TPA: archease [Anaeromyxobacteraceae bacterium]|nr:archease [Anaeromyxobacteraceae bacterium]